jgi:hypothetical protein
VKYRRYSIVHFSKINDEMTSIKNHQITTVLFAIALAGLLLVSTSVVGNGQRGGGHGGGGHGGGSSSSSSSSSSGNSNSLLVDGNNTGINVQTDTNQKQDCQTAGGTSAISGSCIANSNNQITESGGIVKK